MSTAGMPSGLSTLQFKTIDGLKIRYATSKLDILDCGHFAWEDAAADYGRLASEWIKGGYARL